ncbi:MAG: thioredoxin fold domain-containing protein [Rhodospirillales bacterium]|nr:thioredoxin fold domain-containing protein [Rhodospirillales bacterium]MCB9979821.1 thioredoxin fold domain-containing protein [Rhodospirillales bacterium]
MKFSYLRSFTVLAMTCFLALPGPVAAQQGGGTVPQLPEPLQRLLTDGAQVRYLGTINGLDGWVTIQGGQEQYFYVTPDRKNFVMGLLFGEDGRMLTLDQVQALRKKEGDVLDLLTDDQLTRPRLDESTKKQKEFEVKSPSEQLYMDMEESNWVPLGDPSAPFIYTVVDPQCPHCHAFLKDLEKDYIKSGRLQVRLVPIGLRDETRAQAAFLLAAPNPEDVWFRHLNGDQTALPAKTEINQQGVQHNISVIENWRLDVTPFTIYRNKDGKIKVIRGRAEDIEAIMTDLGAKSE